jgi:hypothetical protein
MVGYALGMNAMPNNERKKAKSYVAEPCNKLIVVGFIVSFDDWFWKGRPSETHYGSR